MVRIGLSGENFAMAEGPGKPSRAPAGRADTVGIVERRNTP